MQLLFSDSKRISTLDFFLIDPFTLVGIPLSVCLKLSGILTFISQGAADITRNTV